MKNSDILFKAQLELIERGHTKGDRVARNGRVCLVGAVQVACGYVSGAHDGYSIYTHPALSYVRTLLDGEEPCYWNDNPDTTQSQVEAILYDAGMLAKEQGD